MAGFAIFDLAVIGALAFGALAGFAIGFIRGSLLLLSWTGAAAGTVYLFPLLKPYMRQAIKPDLMADAVGGAALFLSLLILLHLLSYMIADRVRGSRLNMLDRTLGLVAGLLVPALGIGIGYLYGREQLPKEWMKDARTQPVVEQAALWIERMLPTDLLARIGAMPPKGGLRRLEDALPPAEEVVRPKVETPAPAEPGYGGAERRALDDAARDRP